MFKENKGKLIKIYSLRSNFSEVIYSTRGDIDWYWILTHDGSLKFHFNKNLYCLI